MQDDNIVLSLRGNLVRSLTETRLDLQGQSGTYYEAGDTLCFANLALGEREVVRIKAIERYQQHWQPPIITLDRPLKMNIVLAADATETRRGTLVFNESWRLEGARVRHNTFLNTRRYAVFMGAGGVRIESNTMSNFTGAALVLSYLENRKQGHPYYPSSDVLVVGNTIDGAFHYGEGGRVFDLQNRGAITTFDFNRAKLALGDNPFIENIRIISNRIRNSGAQGINMEHVRGGFIEGNRIENANLRNGTNRYGVWIAASKDVVLGKNTFIGSFEKETFESP
jgi:hypothetical protein